jgi:hypothetical protein
MKAISAGFSSEPPEMVRPEYAWKNPALLVGDEYPSAVKIKKTIGWHAPETGSELIAHNFEL